PAVAGSLAGDELELLRVGDVALEELLQERAGTMTPIPPVAEQDVLVLLRVVVVVELAVLAVRLARELGRSAEERGDEHRLRAGSRRAGGVRIARPAGDRPRDVPPQGADNASTHRGAVLGRVLGTVAGTDP